MGRELRQLSFDPNRKLWRIEVVTGEGELEILRRAARDQLGAAARADDKIVPRPISYLHARELRYRDFITVALMVNKPDLFADNWIYVHDPAVRVGRVQNFRSWSPEMVPAGMSCLGLEYFCLRATPCGTLLTRI